MGYDYLLGFVAFSQLTRHIRLIIRFLFVGLRFRYPFFPPTPRGVNLGSRYKVRRQLRLSGLSPQNTGMPVILKSRLWYQMPARKIAFCDEDDCSQTATAWFNTAAAMLYDTDMTELLGHENIYCADEWAEKQKRISALNRLTKQQQMLLYTEVIGFITRYLELSAAFETIEAVITELDYHQSAVKGNGGVTLPQTAYV